MTSSMLLAKKIFRKQKDSSGADETAIRTANSSHFPSRLLMQSVEKAGPFLLAIINSQPEAINDRASHGSFAMPTMLSADRSST